MLARAGLVRLGLGEHIAQRLAPAEFVPAPGQGALGVETRADDERALALCGALDVEALRLAVTAERQFLADLGGGCQVPIGAYAEFADGDGTLSLTGMVAGLDGARLLKRTVSAPASSEGEARDLGRLMADILRAEGCQEILDEVIGGQPPRPGGSA